MKKLLAVLAVSVVITGVVAAGLQTATATHSLPHLIRQINRLENQVSGLQADVRRIDKDVDVLWYDWFQCSFLAEPGEVFADGTFAYPLYYDNACLTFARKGLQREAPRQLAR